MGKKKANVSTENVLGKLTGELVREIANWQYMQKHGCNDPFWPDGANMNLTRNHIIHSKRQIKEVCEENSLPLPGVYYLPTPPEVDNCYMANLKQTKRVARLRLTNRRLVTEKVPYDDEQMSLF